jgi:hypothetical protein
VSTIPLPSQDVLNNLFSYNPDTGVLTRKVATSRSPIGSPVGTPNKAGRLIASVAGKMYFVHRLIWKLVYDEEPSVIDHINRNPQDNRISNLRACTNRQNCGNRVSTGVYQRKHGKWQAICSEKHIGYFFNKEEAVAAYQEAHKSTYGSFSPYHAKTN